MKFSDDGTILLKADDDDITDGTIVIPEELTTIGSCAVRYTQKLEHLTIPEYITIENEAFRYSPHLIWLMTSPGVTIGSYAFHACNSLERVTMAEEVIIGSHAFRASNALKEVCLLRGAYIDEQAFYNCPNLTQLTLSEDAVIGECAFFANKALKKLFFPKGITIGRGAFAQCTGLIQITLSEGVIINHEAFHDCHHLGAIIVNTSNTEEIERVKNSMLPEHRAKVIKKSFSDHLIAFEKNAYQHILHDPRRSNLSHYYKYFKLIFDGLAMIASFEEVIYQNVKKKAAESLTMPTTPETLLQYKIDFKHLIDSKQDEKNMELQISCISKLQSYIDWIKDKKNLKQERFPTFFAQNKTTHQDVSLKLYILDKAIRYLKGDVDLRFTTAEKNMLGHGLIDNVLNQLPTRLRPGTSQSNFRPGG